MKLTIYGRIPSKKNSVCIFTVKGRIYKAPSRKYLDWHKEASGQILRHSGVRNGSPFKEAVISIRFYAPDKRAADLSNKGESIMDLLVDTGIIADDNWFVIKQLTLIFGGIDTARPRAEVEIIQ